MKDGIAHAWAPHVDENGVAHWPTNRSDRDALSSRLLGACIVDAIDGWLEIALDQLHQEQSPLWRRDNGGPERWEKDRAIRAQFQSMTPEQRTAVEGLLVRVLYGAFFSALANLDQFPAGTPEHDSAIADVVVRDAERDLTLASAGEGDIFDFHDRLGGWLDEFSEYAERFRSAD